MPRFGHQGDDAIADQLQSIHITRDQYDLNAHRARLRDGCRHQIVGFITVQFPKSDADSFQDLSQQTHLRSEGVGGFGALGFVVGKLLVAEGGRRGIKGDDEVIGSLFPPQLQQHPQEAIDGIRRRPITGGQRWDGKKGAIKQTVSINDDQLGRRHPFRALSFPSWAIDLHPATCCTTT